MVNDFYKEVAKLRKKVKLLETANRQWFEVWQKLKEEINNKKYFSKGNRIEVAVIECIMAKLEKGEED